MPSAINRSTFRPLWPPWTASPKPGRCSVPFTVLVIDDDEDTRSNLRDVLELDGYRIEMAGSAAETLKRNSWEKIGAVLLDRKLPDGTAEDLLPKLRQLAPDAAVIVITGYSDVLKPINPDELRARLGRIAQHRADRLALKERTEELRATTQQLWQAARLAGVGELAASIAHELNNPLGTISLRIETILSKTPPEDPRRKPLEIVEQEVERMARLVGNLLQFSRVGVEKVSTVDVCEEIR